jgi:zinc/manganese transport system substrate-binding protein
MKKYLIFAITALLAAAAHATPLKVVVTIPDLADFATQIGGDKVQVYAMASGVEDPHNVLMRPSMVTKLAQADLFIVMGLDLEHAYAPALLAESRNQKIQLGTRGYLDCSRGISVREVPKSLDRSEGDVHPHGNPHYNTDPGRMRIVAGEIAERLSELDPADAALFQSNAKTLQARLDAKIIEWKQKLAGKDIRFISYHPVWPYFAERFGVVPVGTIQPKPGIEPGPRYVDELIARMKAENVRLIVKESFYSDRLPKQIAAATGARLVSIPIQVHATKEATDYIAFMDAVVNAFAGKE